MPGADPRKGNTRKNFPTIRQRRAFEIYMENLAKGDPISFGEIMLRAGFSKASSQNPGCLTVSRGWEILKKELDGEGAKEAFNDLVKKNNEDKRVRLAAAIEITKIQGGYPAQENKVIGFFGDLEKLRKQDDNRPGDTTTEDSVLPSSGAEESSGV